jgi:hypothetical protein
MAGCGVLRYPHYWSEKGNDFLKDLKYDKIEKWNFSYFKLYQNKGKKDLLICMQKQ